MSDSISVTIEYEKVEINILGPDFIQVNLLEPTILESVSENTTKLATIEEGAEVNNISDGDAEDLTDGGETNLHTHPGGGGGWSRAVHGSITVTEEFSANFTEHTASIDADIGFTFANFSELQPRIRIKLTVASGNPDVTPPAAADLSADSPQNLNNMATGVYLVEVVSFDDGTGYSYTVSHFEAGATSSITTPIFAADDIALLFSEAQNPATVLTIGNGTGTVELFNVTAAVFVPAVISTADNTAWSLNPDSNMTVGSDYELHLKKEITSLVGNRKYSGENQTFTVAASPFEDYTTYTEVDPSAFLTVTPTKISAANITRDITTYVYTDKGVGYFAGNFEHQFEITYNDAGSVDSGIVHPWGMANTVNDLKLIQDAFGDVLSVYCSSTPAGTTATLVLREINGGSVNQVALSTQLADGVKYYCTVERDEAVGTFGTLYLRVYSDASRVTLVDSILVTLTEKQDFRYLYGISSYNTGAANTISVDVENLNLI